MTIVTNLDWLKLVSQDDVPLPGLYNIRDISGRLMLSHDVERFEAEQWLDYYLTRYAAGRPFENGKGFHPDYGFHIVEVTADGAYEESVLEPFAA
ncbi:MULTISPECIES: hypothetical protein [unclassified Bradyrhizobium]|uniref:hypothetical protein n=1 Tax=unclassified Bradyrhizobium TaxID=2631580 RepID=UPI0029165167|nr:MULTISPECIES: hypothetical protein [unclassified Bradyrhizobium]